jgi:hypothetical protein
MTGRRVSLPGADELFRSTSPMVPGGAPAPAPEPEPEPAAPATSPTLASVPENGGTQASAHQGGGSAAPRDRRRPSGRERHEEKITVYCSGDELLDLERARLTLRGEHGLAVDRGRIVRAAVSLALAELEAKGRHSRLLEHLRNT